MIIIDKNAKNRKSGNLPLMDGTVTFQDGTLIDMDASTRGDSETDGEWVKRVEAFIKKKWFSGRDVVIELIEEDGEWADYWVEFRFKCHPDLQSFAAKVYDLVWEGGIGRDLDVFDANASYKGMDFPTLTEENVDPDGYLITHQCYLFE